MFDPTLMRQAIRRIAEERIREAEERGVFNNLPGHGKPLEHLEERTEEGHLALWMRLWMLREQAATKVPRSKP